jgi:hypothetical protein
MLDSSLSMPQMYASIMCVILTSYIELRMFNHIFYYGDRSASNGIKTIRAKRCEEIGV